MSVQHELGDLDGVLAAGVASGVVPGVVAHVAVDGTEWLRAFGRRDARAGDPMRTDTIFRIASLTKLVTAISVLRLVERGLVTLDTPVGDVLPAFDELQVLEGFDGDRPRLRPPASRATLRRLLTHTSGLAYDIWNADVSRYHEVSGVPRLQTGSRASFAIPLVADPGARFSYGTSMDWVGLIVEQLDGRPLERYWEEELFRPLAMIDTVVDLDDARRARTAPVHARGPAGEWEPTAIDFAQHPEVYAGGHCLYSTAADFARVQQALVGDGASPGARILEPETLAAMFQNQLGDLDVGVIDTADPAQSADVDLRGRKWGLGLLVEPGGPRAGGGWMGGFNTFCWIDRARGLTIALYAQTVPFYADGVVELWRSFEAAAYALVAPVAAAG